MLVRILGMLTVSDSLHSDRDMALAQTNRWMLISKGQGRESERVEADQGIGNGLCSKVESRPSVLIILPKESWLNRKRKGVHCVA